MALYKFCIIIIIIIILETPVNCDSEFILDTLWNVQPM